MADFGISIGISSGVASVGFYGSSLHLKSYTAIGRAINLAARLGAAARAQQIIVSSDIVEKLQKRKSDAFILNDRGSTKLKGFESDDIRISELIGTNGNEATLGVNRSHTPTCKNGHGLLYLATNSLGIFIYKCRTCNYHPNDHDADSKKPA